MEVRKRSWTNKKTGKKSVSWFVDFVDKHTGERVRETLKGCESRLSAQEAAARLFAHREKNPNLTLKAADSDAEHSISLGRLLELHRARPGIAAWTRSIEQTQAKNLTAKLGNETPVLTLSSGDLDAYVEARLKEPRGAYKRKDGTYTYSKATVGGATVVKELKLLNQAIRWGLVKRFDVREPFSDRELPNIAVFKKRPRCLTKEEIGLLFGACGEDGTYLRQAAEVCYYSALRRAELFRLTWSNVDFDNQCFRFFTHKRGGSDTMHEDVVYLPRRVMELLALRYEQLGEPGKTELVFGVAPREWQGVETTVDQGFGRMLMRAARRAGIVRPKEIGVHTLRHTCATQMLMAGISVPEVAAHLRHRDGGALLLKTYAHVFDENRKRAAAVIAGEAYDPGIVVESALKSAQKGTKNIVDIRKAPKNKAKSA